MGNENIFTVIVAVLTIVGSMVGVWTVTRRNASEVDKAKGLSEATARNAETKERSDLLDMLKESTKQGAIWLEALKQIEKSRELDYSTTKALIEDGTLETVNARKEVVKGVEVLTAKADEHNTNTVNILQQMSAELTHVKAQVDAMPGKHAEILSRLDVVIGSVEMLRVKKVTGEIPKVPNGATPEPSLVDILPKTTN